MASQKKSPSIYAFIDSQNVNLGIQSLGWKLDWRKFRQYLRNKYHVQKAYLCIGHLPGNESLYTYLQECDFILIFKPTLIRREAGEIVTKGNVDAELVLHAMIHYRHFDQAIIVSGDGDFHCLIEYLANRQKLLKVLAPTQHYSGLLRTFNRDHYIVRLDLLRRSLEYKKTGIRGRSKP